MTIPKTFKIDGFLCKVRCLGAGYQGFTDRNKWELLVKIGTSWMRESHCYLPLEATEADARKRLAG